MPQKPERVEIDDQVFYVRKPLPREAVRNVAYLQGVLVKPLAALDAGGLMDALSLDSRNLAGVLELVGEISKTLDERTVDRILDMMLNPTYVSVVTDDPHLPEQLTAKVVDKVFEDDFSRMLELAVRVALVQYRPVFQRGRRLYGEAQEKLAAIQSVSSVSEPLLN